MPNMPDQSATSYSPPPLSTSSREDAPDNGSEHSVQKTEIISPADGQIPALTNPSASNGYSRDFDIDEMRNASLRKEDLMPRVITSIKIDGWHESVDASTSDEKILEALSMGSYELRTNLLPRISIRSVEGEAILFFEDLHLINIRQLQLRLLANSRGLGEQAVSGDSQQAASVQSSQDKLHETLHCYRQALDDFEAFQSKCQRFPSQLSQMGGLATYLKSQGISIFCLGEGDVNKSQKNLQFLLSVTTHTFVQFVFAAVGGLALIVPMLIMVFVPGRTASVVTTCVAVFIFATTLAGWSSAAHYIERSEHPLSRLAQNTGLRFGAFEPKDIVLITATYAAVLMVFVGASI